jgi:PHD-finger
MTNKILINFILDLGGIDNVQSLMPIDFNFQRQTIQNDHCYTPLTHTQQSSSPAAAGSSKNSQPKSAKREQKPSAKVRENLEDSSDSGEAALEDDEEYEEEQSGEDISFTESDDDNDIDFSVNDRFGKKGKKKRKYRKHKQKSSTFKDFLETGEVPEEKGGEEGKKKYSKSPKKLLKASTSGKNAKNVVKVPVTTVMKVTVQPVMKIVQPVLKTLQILPKPVQPIKKPAQFIPLTSSFMKSPQISVSSTKSKQEIEFVESIVKDLEKNFPETQDNSKKLNIMQMMETNTPAEDIDATLEQLESDGAVPGIDEIGDALIAVLGNDAIDELFNQNELMNFSEPMIMSTPEVLPIMQPKILNKTLPVVTTPTIPGKDPIKVVRHGRVITLPAIEAPATRGAKRRAQGDSPNTSLEGSFIESPRNSVEPQTNLHRTPKVLKTEKTPDPDSKNSSRRSSLSGKSSRRQSIVPGAVDELDDLISDASVASEDDPDRLWCICKMPHNNRFMISCDKCEDWFHGKCVNVTKAMGKEYELMGKEWRCPNCKADPGKKVDTNKKPLNQQKLTKFFAKSQKESTDEDVAKTMCVVCQSKAARDASIYCSDECIQNHATKHLDGDASGSSGKTTPKGGGDAAAAKRGNVLKDKNGNVSCAGICEEVVRNGEA